MPVKTSVVRNSSPEPSTADVVRWCILALVVITDFFVVKSPWLSFFVFLLPISFALLHSWRYFGRRQTVAIFVIIVVVSYLTEYLGVHTGQVFGKYFYNPDPNVNGFLVGGVPPLVTFSYVSMGYSCYVLARILCRQLGRLRGWFIITVPAVAAGLMTLWDMTFDPVVSYQKHLYTWQTGGAYFGVPLRNFGGWFFESLIFFLLISLYIEVRHGGQPADVKPDRWFLAEVLILMAASALSVVAVGLHSGATLTEQAMALVALFGFGMPIALGAIQLQQKRTT